MTEEVKAIFTGIEAQIALIEQEDVRVELFAKVKELQTVLELVA